MDRLDLESSARWRQTAAWRTAATGLLVALALVAPARAEVLRAGGTGSVHGLLKLIGAAFAAQDRDTRIEIVPGLGSAGGIHAVADGVIDVALTGRPLKLDEAFRPVTASLLAHTAFGLASSHPDPGTIASSTIADFLVNPKSAWPDGVPLRVILRPVSESDSDQFATHFPRVTEALARLRRRPEIPIASTDQENLALAETIEGSLTSIGLAQILIEKPNLNLLAIDGIAPTLDNIENGSYPYQKPLYLVVPTVSKPAVARLVEFIRSAEGEQLLRDNGCLPVRK